MAIGHKTGGRTKGTPNKFSGTLKEMILTALDRAGGPEYLTQQAQDNPAAFMALVGKVLPMTIANDGDKALKIEIVRFADASAE